MRKLSVILILSGSVYAEISDREIIDYQNHNGRIASFNDDTKVKVAAKLEIGERSYDKYDVSYYSPQDFLSFALKGSGQFDTMKSLFHVPMGTWKNVL